MRTHCSSQALRTGDALIARRTHCTGIALHSRSTGRSVDNQGDVTRAIDDFRPAVGGIRIAYRQSCHARAGAIIAGGALDTGRTGQALRTSQSCIALGALGTCRASHALQALCARCAGRTRQTGITFQTLWTRGAGSTRGTGIAFCSLQTLRSDRTGCTCCASGSNGASIPLQSLDALRPNWAGRSLQSLWTSRPGVAFQSLWSDWAYWALSPRHTLRTRRASRPSGTSCARRAFQSLRSYGACRSCRTRRTCRPLWPLRTASANRYVGRCDHVAVILAIRLVAVLESQQVSPRCRDAGQSGCHD